MSLFCSLTARLKAICSYVELPFHKPLFEKLYALEFCSRCITRCIGVREKDAYISPNLDGPPIENQCLCPGCFGLLQSMKYDYFGEQLHTKYQSSTHRGLEDFMMSIRVPNSLLIRQRIIVVLM